MVLHYTVGRRYDYLASDYGGRDNALYHARVWASKWNLTVYNLRDAGGEHIGYYAV